MGRINMTFEEARTALYKYRRQRRDLWGTYIPNKVVPVSKDVWNVLNADNDFINIDGKVVPKGEKNA